MPLRKQAVVKTDRRAECVCRGHVQNVDTNSTSPHPPRVWSPAKPAADTKRQQREHKRDTSEKIGS